MKKKSPMVSIIILVHNAPYYVKKTLTTLKNTVYEGGFERIVVDNDSDNKTKRLLFKSFNKKNIDKVLFLNKNNLFAKGNNIGARLCDNESKLILLLNSDVEIKDKFWLEKMVNKHKKGITSLGYIDSDSYSRADGYCFMIDKELYNKYKLDEDFEWFWSITKIQSEVLRDGFKVQAVNNHENLLHHFGGASGNDWRGAKGMDIEMKKVVSWFKGKNVDKIEEI